MDMILISGDKLKVILNEQDMTEMHIDVESFDYGSVSTKKAFWCILEKARSLTGFDADMSKLYVEVFPDRHGGCEMYITKLFEEKTEEKKEKAQRSTACEGATRQSTGKKRQRNSSIAVRVGFEPLLRLCERICRSGVHYSASLYFLNSAEEDNGESYVLVLRRPLPSYVTSGGGRAAFPAYLSEYGEVKKMTSEAFSVLSERAEEVLYDRAVEILSQLC